jgi:hypothetical protein
MYFIGFFNSQGKEFDQKISKKFNHLHKLPTHLGARVEK